MLRGIPPRHVRPTVGSVTVEYDGKGKAAGTRVRRTFARNQEARRFYFAMSKEGRNPAVVAAKLEDK